MHAEHEQLRQVIDRLAFAAHLYREALRAVEEQGGAETKDIIADFRPHLEKTDPVIGEWAVKCGHELPEGCAFDDVLPI